MEEAIAAVGTALAERAAGTLVAPPRTTWPVPPSALTITPGGLGSLGALGMRVYVRGVREDQLTAVWRIADAGLEGIVVGPELGRVRTGAIGGLAIRCLAPARVRTVGILGGGPQSRTQLLAARVVRPSITEVRLFRRDPERRAATAAAWAAATGLPVRAVESPRAAVDGAELVILATDSSTPVVDARWLAPGAHVNTLGPKYRGNSEIGEDLLASADRLVSDFPEQYRDEPEFIGHGRATRTRLRDLAEVVAAPPDRPEGERTVFLSHGLAGTEVAVARRALANAERLGIGVELDLEN
jgi:ornithine cyclodeaminase/alanine dehydrogenase-like protein (mu-crystallin family)